MFKALGILIAAYVVYSAAAGHVYAKDGPSGRTLTREDAPRYFWVVLACYAALGVALLTVF